MRPRILGFSFFPAFVPPANGGVERLFNVYFELAKRFDVTLLTSTRIQDQREEVIHAPGFREIRVPKDNHFEDSYVSLLEHAGKGDISGPALGSSTENFGSMHEEYLRLHSDVDLIIHDSPFLIRCDLLRGFDGKPRIYQSYNFETGLYSSFHSRKDLSRTIENLVRELEEDVCRSADLITTCSTDDAEAIANAFAPSAPIISVPNGFTPTFFSDPVARSLNSLLFLGSGHQPNIEAVELIRSLAARLPDIEFNIIGSCAPPVRDRNFIAHGIVDQQTKGKLLRNATAAINPITGGSGSSLKVADIADHRLPLLSTRLGARGFDVEPGVHYVEIRPDTLLEDIEEALEDRSHLKAVADNAFNHFRERFGWQAIGKDFADVIEKLLSGAKPANARLVLNDYDSFSVVGGGATRTRGLCRGLSETSRVIFLTFAESSNSPIRRLELDGRALVLQVPKTHLHVSDHQADQQRHWVSTADLVNYLHASSNIRMRELFRCAAAVSSAVVCEHPYMVGLPRHFGVQFVYSSQNFELELKRSLLADHPRRDELLSIAEQAEAFACGGAMFIVAVSNEDARQLSGSYAFTAPILVIPNGAEGPAGSTHLSDATPHTIASAVFMGSAHMPNIEAARWIVDKLAPRLPNIEFIIMGSVCDCLDAESSVNVTLLSTLPAEEKSRVLFSAFIALNPMVSGSGSNVKVADFLQHGLRVLSTPFGARGYENVPTSDVTLAELRQMLHELPRILEQGPDDLDIRRRRMDRYRQSLSMAEGGRVLAKLVDEHSGVGKRALYVTYRYNEPAIGGGEAYVVRLVQSLARSGWFVDVVSPAADKIVDVDRFAARFSGEENQPIPIGHARVRSGKFPLEANAIDQTKISALWNEQSAYEAHLLKGLPLPSHAALAWGWADATSETRWCFTQSAFYLPEPADVSFVVHPIGPMWVRLHSETGELLYADEVKQLVRVDQRLPAGFSQFSCSVHQKPDVADPRPLAMLFEKFQAGSVNLLQQRVSDVWSQSVEPAQLFDAHDRAARATRAASGLRLSDERVGSKQLLHYVSARAGDYDVLITHNAVFGAATHAVDAASVAGTPSVFIPHLHLDDDFYHFPDVMQACSKATEVLVAPRAAAQFLRDRGLHNIRDHAPGVDTGTSFLPADRAKFRQTLGRDDPFFLVLGRKAPAKGYHDILAAITETDDLPLIVMIGPDDDGEPIESTQAVYLGQQPPSIVRGALGECLGLVNMSRSESFGMVLLEAGLAGKPVIANNACAAFADLVDDRVNGFLVSRENLAARMTELAENAPLREALGSAGRRRALQYDWNLIERDFVDLCNRLATSA